MTTKRPTVAAAEEILGLYFPVLDHGFVALVDYLGGDADVERAARVSYGSGTRSTSDTRTLLRYLRRCRHTSPSEMVEVKLHCAMPIFIARQWIRHRTASVNEYSGRYSLMPMLFYTPPHEQMKRQSASNKQGRAGEPLSREEYDGVSARWQASRAGATLLYEELTAEGLAKELARIDLPLSTYTQWYWKIDLHNLLHFLTLRVDRHAQWEIREYGQTIAGMVQRLAPLSFEAWLDYDVCATRFSRHERVALARMLRNGPSVAGDIERAVAGLDLSKREVAELAAKLVAAEGPPPEFALDLSAAKSPEHFEQMYRDAAPRGEQPPAG